MRKHRAWQQYARQKSGAAEPWPPPHWQRRGGRLFVRFLFVFGLMVLLVLGGMAVFALLVTRAVGGSNEVALIVWLGGCGLALALPILAITIGSRAFRTITTPLADVMAAADAVAAGDLTVRVVDSGRHNQFGQLVRSFNRMTEELQRSDQLRRNLSADVAHELRTPLHIIQGNLEGVLDGVYDPTPDHIDATLEETRMLARLVDDLHTLSQGDAGHLSLRIETVDVSALLSDVATSFSGQAAAMDVALDVVHSDELADLLITGDADRLEQVLSNLVINALRHTPAGGRVSVHARRVDATVQIIVADTGDGIAAEELPYIFERFWRGDAARTHTDGAGAGLGLAISKQLIEAHSGTIDVTSDLGAGTRFTISLPAA